MNMNMTAATNKRPVPTLPASMSILTSSVPVAFCPSLAVRTGTWTASRRKAATSQRKRGAVRWRCAGSGQGQGSGGEEAAWGLLSERVRKLRDKEVAQDRRLAQNWQHGRYTHGIVAAAPGDYFRKLVLRDDRLACGTASGSVLLFDLRTAGRQAAAAAATAHSGQVTALAHTSSYLASAGSEDRVVRVWRVPTASTTVSNVNNSDNDNSDVLEQAFVLQARPKLVTALVIDEGEGVIYVAGLDGYVHVHALSDGQRVRQIQVAEPVYAMVLTEKQYLLAGCASGSVKAYQAARGSFLLSIACHKANTTALDFCEENQTLVTGDSAGNIRAWSFRDSSCLGDVTGHGGAVMSIQVDHAKIVSAGRDGCVNVAMLNTLERLYSIPGYTKYLANASFDRTRLIADGTNDIVICRYFDHGVDNAS